MTTDLVITTVGLISLGVFFMFYVSVYNHVQGLVNIIPEVASNINVLVKKRTDLISKLITIVDSYGLHERGINVSVAGDFAGRPEQTGGGAIVARLASLRMAFPELKADSLYSALMEELAQVETDISNRRERFNSTVRAYNTMLAQFPNNLLLAPFSFQPKAFLSNNELSS